MDQYEKLAPFYDILELDDSGSTQGLNRFLGELLNQHGVKCLADVACGTGAQSLELCKNFEVQASDLSPAMVARAREKWSENARSFTGRHCVNKVQTEGEGAIESEISIASLNFEVADMCKVDVSQCEAVIAMYNAVGHISRDQFVKTLRKWLLELQGAQLIILDAFSADYYKVSAEESAIGVETDFHSELDFEGKFQGKDLRRWVSNHVSAEEKCGYKESYLECSWKTDWGGEIFVEESKVRLISKVELKDTYSELKKEFPRLRFSLKALSEGDMYLFYLYQDKM